MSAPITVVMPAYNSVDFIGEAYRQLVFLPGSAVGLRCAKPTYNGVSHGGTLGVSRL